MIQPKTVLDAFKMYEAEMLKLGKSAGNMQTALLRFTVPGWGGHTPTNSRRSTKQDVQAGLDFLDLLPIEKLNEGKAAQDKFFGQASTTARQRNNARYYLNTLIALAESERWLQTEKQAEVLLPSRLNLVEGRRITPIPKLTDKKKKPTYVLGSQPEDFVNAHLQSQMDKFRQWCMATRLSASTFDTMFHNLKQFFGWLVRYELASQWQTLQGEERTNAFNKVMNGLQLEDMIPFYPLPRKSSFTNRNEYFEAKEHAEDIRDEEAKQALKRFGRFLDFYSDNCNTRVGLVGMAIRVAKYLYEDHIDEGKPETIPPVLLKLKTLQKTEVRKRKTSPKAVPIEKKFVEYKEVLQVVVILKKLVDQKEGVNCRPRKSIAMIWACSRFLIVSFLSLLPPDRQQLIRELEIGKSFAKGCFGAGNIFIPEAEMSDPSKAHWCFNLTKYKTHEVYGDCKVTLPDYDFGDGTTLYHYIDLWLNQYRPLLEPKGDWLFVKHHKGEKLKVQSVHAMITKIFYRYTGKPVNPHMFRHIFNTHLSENNASEAVKTASRKLMKQSDKIAESNYTHAITDRAVAPAIEYMKGMIDEAFKG